VSEMMVPLHISGMSRVDAVKGSRPQGDIVTPDSQSWRPTYIKFRKKIGLSLAFPAWVSHFGHVLWGLISTTSGSCSCHEHTTNLTTGVSRQPVLDCGTIFHRDCDL